MKIFRKLVRDRVSEIMEADGKKPVTRILDDREYGIALENKLLEEVQEMRQGADKKEEIADIHEVLDALIAAHGFSQEEILEIQKKKRAARGGFSKKIFLESAE